MGLPRHPRKPAADPQHCAPGQAAEGDGRKVAAFYLEQFCFIIKITSIPHIITQNTNVPINNTARTLLRILIMQFVLDLKSIYRSNC